MRPIFNHFFISIGCLWICAISFAQNINIKVVDRQSGKPFSACTAFIIDPIDQSVLSYRSSDTAGICQFELLGPLKSKYFQLKLLGLNVIDTIITLEYTNQKKYIVEWDRQGKTKLLVVNYDKEGKMDFRHNDTLIWRMYKYVTDYNKSEKYYLHLEFLEEMKRYNASYENYKKELAWADSATKADPDLSVFVPSYPMMPEEVDMVMTFVSEQLVVAGGINFWLNESGAAKILKPEFNRKKTFSLLLSFKHQGYDAILDSVLIYNHENKLLSKSKILWKQMKGKYNPLWREMKINGKEQKLLDGLFYQIEFIYKER